MGLTTHTPAAFTLNSSCVVDPDRNVLKYGRYCTKFDLTGDAKRDGVRCDKPEGHAGAAQIFPLLMHNGWRTSTVKHHCTKTDLAACLRACSNNVGPSYEVERDFSGWFRRVIIPEFLKALDSEIINVDYKTWLKRFPNVYKQKIEKAADPEFQDHKKYSYEAFAKIEQQFTTVLHEHKDSNVNTTKERQICGPSEQKKLYGNPFIYQMEGVAHRHMKHYCGRKNWIQICETIDKHTAKMLDAIFGAADGSGFDMTQLKWVNELMNELLLACAEHVNVHFVEPLSVDELKKVLTESLILDVVSSNVHYVTQGRASGDGWTTFGNTTLMASYWRYVFHKAGITDFFLMVKGDDVLMAVERKHLRVLEETWPKYFTRTKTYQDYGLGQICTKIQFGPIEELDFLSNHFFRTANGKLRMTRIPARVFQSNSWSTKMVPFINHPNYYKYAQELVYSKGMCLRAWAKGLPIWEKLADKMISLGKPGKLSEFNEYSDGVRVWHGNDDRESYLWYLEMHYGMTVTDVNRIESAIASITCLSGIVHIPELDKFYSDI